MRLLRLAAAALVAVLLYKLVRFVLEPDIKI